LKSSILAVTNSYMQVRIYASHHMSDKYFL